MKAHILIPILIISLLFCNFRNISAQDTIAVPGKVKRFLKSDPLRATMLAVALPGLGQIYNRKFFKVPFVYAGFGGAVFFITYNSTNYSKFMKAYQDFTDDIPQTDSYLELIRNADPATYDPVLHPKTFNPSTASWYSERMLRQVDLFKKYRDLSYIGFAAWYLLTVLDANVDASLLNYDISNNLNLQVEPVQVPKGPYTTLGLNVSMKVFF